MKLETKHYSNGSLTQYGQRVYKYYGKYYSKNVDSHKGGIWKFFEKSGGRLKRIGTADKDLNIIKNNKYEG